MKRAVIYARVSTREQDTNYSIPSQIEGAKDYAQRHDMKVVGVYHEDASGLWYPRPKLEEALQKIEDGEADVIVAHTDDRINRHEINGFLIRKRIGDAKAELHYTLTGPCDLGDEHRMFAMIKDAIAANEVRTSQERMTRGKRYKAKSGTWVGSGRPPYGYRATGSGRETALEINEEEAKWVREIFAWYISGVGVPQIAKRLQAHGVPRPGMTRNPANDVHPLAWADASIYNILRRETYAGKYYANRHIDKRPAGKPRICKERPREEWIEIAVPAIIDEKTFAKAQERMASGRQESFRNRKYKYLMNNRLTCGFCGHSISTMPAERGKYMYYRCHSYRRDTALRERCKFPVFHVAKVDGAIWDCVKHLLRHPDALRLSVEQAQEQARQSHSHIHDSIAAIDEEIAKQEAKLQRAVELYLDSEGFTRQLAKKTQEEIEGLLQGLHKERLELSQQVMQAELSSDSLAAIEEYIAGIREELDLLELDDQRAIIEALGGRAKLTIEQGERIVYLTILLQTYRLDLSGESFETDNSSSCSLKDSLKLPAPFRLTFRLVLAA